MEHLVGTPGERNPHVVAPGDIPETSPWGLGINSCADAWAWYGFDHLHPIIPRQPVDECRLFSWARAKGWSEAQARKAWERVYGGKCPGALDARGRWFGLNVQQPGVYADPGLAEDMQRAWDAGAGIGVLGRCWPCLDVDITEDRKAYVIANYLGDVFGDRCFLRIGRAPKFAMPFRWAPGWEGVRKLTIAVAETETERGPVISERIEVIGAGYQWVLDGIHGSTGWPYVWTSGRNHLIGSRPHADQLPVLGREDLKCLMGCLRSIVGLPGAKGAVKGRWHAGLPVGGLQDPLEGSGEDLGGEDVRKAQWRARQLRGPEQLTHILVGSIPNERGVTYDPYIAMLHAIMGASGGESWGLAAWLAWCSTWPGDQPETNKDKWFGLHTDSVRIGMGWLLKHAQITERERSRYFMEWFAWAKQQEAEGAL